LFAVSGRLAEAVLKCLFKNLVLQRKPARQPFPLLNPVCESGFPGRLIVELAPAVLSLPVVEQTGSDVVTAAHLGGTAYSAEQFGLNP